MSIRVRFAPSPTGHIHVGNVRTALFKNARNLIDAFSPLASLSAVSSLVRLAHLPLYIYALPSF